MDSETAVATAPAPSSSEPSLQLPTLDIPVPPSGSLFEYVPVALDITASLQGAPRSATAGEILRVVEGDFATYQSRLETQLNQLKERIEFHRTTLQDEKAVFAASNASSHRKLTEQLEADKKHASALSRGSVVDGSLPHTARLNFAAVRPPVSASSSPIGKKSKSGDDEEDLDDAGKRLIEYWKRQHAILIAEHGNVANEHEQLQRRLQDLHYVTNTEQYKTHRMVGVLREKEAAERARGDAYQQLLDDLISGQAADRPKNNKEKSVPSSTGRPTSPANTPVVELTPIEKKRVESEAASMDACLRAADEELAALRGLQSLMKKRKEVIDNKVLELQRMPPPARMTLDDTLETVMNLRTEKQEIAARVAAAAEPENASKGRVADLKSSYNTFDAAARELEADLARQKVRDVELDDDKERAAREYRVQRIRALHSGGRDPDDHFARLRAERSIAVISRNIAEAEEEKRRLVRHVDTLMTNAKATADFIGKVRPPVGSTPPPQRNVAL